LDSKAASKGRQFADCKSAMQRSAAKPQPNLAKRLECVQLAAALDQRWMAGRFGALDRQEHSTAAASCTHSKRFAPCNDLAVSQAWKIVGAWNDFDRY